MNQFAQLKSGMTAERRLAVEEGLTVSHTGTPVLSTPMMISLMEKVAMNLAQEHLPAGFTTVGYEVCVRHKAPARIGAAIKVWCRLTEVDGRKLLFEVRATEGEKIVGEGLHRRTIIPVTG
jgi:predicted thioesterase